MSLGARNFDPSLAGYPPSDCRWDDAVKSQWLSALAFDAKTDCVCAALRAPHRHGVDCGAGMPLPVTGPAAHVPTGFGFEHPWLKTAMADPLVRGRFEEGKYPLLVQGSRHLLKLKIEFERFVASKSGDELVAARSNHRLLREQREARIDGLPFHVRSAIGLSFADEPCCDVKGEHVPAPDMSSAKARAEFPGLEFKQQAHCFRTEVILMDMWGVANPLPTELLLDVLDPEGGANLQFRGERLSSTTSRNRPSALGNSDEALALIAENISKKWWAGFYERSPLPGFKSAPFGLVPKDSGKEGVVAYRLIWDKSAVSSINQATQKIEVKMQRAEEAIDAMRKAGTKCMFIKIDIKSAYSQLPVRFVDWPLSGAYWPGSGFLFSPRLNFGGTTAGSVWERFGAFIAFALGQWAPQAHVARWVDDFLMSFVSIAGIEGARELLFAVLLVAERYGIPVNYDKLEVGSRAIYFGIVFDAEKQTVAIKPAKRDKFISALQDLQSQSHCSLAQVDSVRGMGYHVAPVIPFLKQHLHNINRFRYNDEWKSVKRPSSCRKKLAMPSNALRDVFWMECAMQAHDQFSAVFFKMPVGTSRGGFVEEDGEAHSFSQVWQVDACKQGFGFVSLTTGTCGRDSFTQDELELCAEGLKALSSPLLEALGLIAAIVALAPACRGQNILIESDNKPLVLAWAKKYSPVENIMLAIGAVELLCVAFDFHFTLNHIPRAQNCIADALSYDQMQRFRRHAATQGVSPTLLQGPRPPVPQAVSRWAPQLFSGWE